MTPLSDNESDMIAEFRRFINDETYPCVAARAAMARWNIPCVVAGHMACPHDDRKILAFLYDFIKQYRKAPAHLHSATVIFQQPRNAGVETFDTLLWQRLQALSTLDASKFPYDRRVKADPSDANFSFSLGEEAFFIIGLHPASERPARRFRFPALVFNPHAQFELMRKENRYEKMKQIVRKRDKLYSGSINPMLADFGEASEVFQYSGRQYDGEWTCPLRIMHDTTDDNSSPK